MLSVLQRLGKLKYRTRAAYQLKHDITELQQRLVYKETYLKQINTVLQIQKEDLERTAAAAAAASNPRLPLNMVYTYSEIERREQEWEAGRNWIEAHRKEYAYKVYQLNALHNEIFQLIDSTQEDAKMFGVPFDFPAAYQAVQDTSHPM